MVFPDVVDIGSEYFVLYLSCVYRYICSADYAELTVLLYLLQCLVCHMLSKMNTWCICTYEVPGRQKKSSCLRIHYFWALRAK